MTKLYKSDAGKIKAYHEAWVSEPKQKLIEHFGKLGEQGEVREHKYDRKLHDEENIERILESPRRGGFKEFDEEKFDWLIIEFPVESDGFASEDELSVRYSVEDLMNEALGWTGLGHCEGGSSGMGTMEVACPVVNYDSAKPVVERSLQEKNIKGFRIYKEDRD